MPLCSVGEDKEMAEIYLLLLRITSSSNQSKFAWTCKEGKVAKGTCCHLSFMNFFHLFGRVNRGKAISSRPFNHVMTGPRPVFVRVCVPLNCGSIDQSQCCCDGIEGQGWPWTQRLPGSLPSSLAPLRSARGHLSKFYLIPEVLDLSVIAYERGD